MNKEEEYVIIKNVIDGNSSDFELLVDRHKDFVFSICLGIVKNKEEAEELAMDTFVKAYQKITSFHFESKFSTWLYTIAYRESLMLLRKRKGHYSAVDLLEDEEASSTTMSQIHQAEQREIIDQALNELSIHDRSMVSLYYLQEMNFKEIEELTGIKAGTVKVKIHRLKSKLQKILIEQLPAMELKNII